MFKAALIFYFLTSTALADEYRLVIDKHGINLLGKQQWAVLANAQLPSPTLHWRQGEVVNIAVENRLKEHTSIHWHGLILPFQMDGVPGISFSGIEPGETFHYSFQINQSGTYWYHGHSGLQEQLGLYGALIIDPIENKYPVERDYAIILSDWQKANPYRTLARLKKQSDYYNYQKRTVFDFFKDIDRLGLKATINDRLAWGKMRMDPTDLADVTGYTYTYLINGKTPAMDWFGLFNPGEKIRLRFINASAMTYFDVRIPGLVMKVIEADGQPVKPVLVDGFRIAVAETFDVIVEPEQEQPYAIFAEAMDRSGYAFASLTPNASKRAEVPETTPRTLLRLSDMGGMHEGHDDMSNSNTAEQHDMAMNEMHHAMKDDSKVHEHSRHENNQENQVNPVLQYGMLQSAVPGPEWHAPDREITLRLTGNMNRYIWSFNDVKYSESEPILVNFGEHIRFTYINETMMNHPIHLHGLWQYIDNNKGSFNLKKHVVNVKPGETVHVDVLADAEGAWAFHCHLLYHMDTGMFRKFVVKKNDNLDA